MIVADSVKVVCAVCGQQLGAGGYSFTTAEGRVLKCLRHAVTHRPALGRAALVALIVGTILFVINQLDVVLSGHATPTVYAKSILTFGVPFSVSLYSALAVNRRR